MNMIRYMWEMDSLIVLNRKWLHSLLSKLERLYADFSRNKNQNDELKKNRRNMLLE